MVKTKLTYAYTKLGWRCESEDRWAVGANKIEAYINWLAAASIK